MNKPNPVKKSETKEYCYTEGDGRCDYYRKYGYCERHSSRLPSDMFSPIKRPPLCTDETFVRVKIEPVVVNDKEYCWFNFKECSHYHCGGTRDYCRITGEQPKGHYYEDRKWCRERPDECRKLEVE